jgi:hypothetical protein
MKKESQRPSAAYGRNQTKANRRGCREDLLEPQRHRDTEGAERIPRSAGYEPSSLFLCALCGLCVSVVHKNPSEKTL